VSINRSQGTVGVERKRVEPGLARFGNSEPGCRWLIDEKSAFHLLTPVVSVIAGLQQLLAVCHHPPAIGCKPQKESFLLRSSVKRSHHAQTNFLSFFSGFLK
jgi:hypothetical protein